MESGKWKVESFRILILIVLLSFVMALPIGAYESEGQAALDTDGLLNALTPEALEQMEGLNPRDISVEEGGRNLFDKAVSGLRDMLRQAAGVGFLILALCLFLSLVTAFAKSTGIEVSQKVIDMTAVCAMLLISLTSTGSIITQCSQAIQGLDTFSNAFIPVFGLATALSGRPVSGVASAGATMMFSKVIITLSYGIFIPALYLYIATVATGAMGGSSLSDKVAGLIKSISTAFFKGFLMIFTGYLSISGLVSGSADTAMVKTAQVAISGVVPVVGGIISGVSESLLTGASMLRASIGVYGMLAACAICLIPFVRVFAHMLVFKVLAALSGSFIQGSSGKMLDGISNAYSMALGLLGTCCAVQFIAIVVGMVVTNR